MLADTDAASEGIAALLDGLDPDQREAVVSPGAPLCILAGAGSGKTRVLTRRVARRVLDGSADASHVLVLTFTRQAASELVRRLRSFGLRERPIAGTFHSVAWSVLRQRWADENRRAPELLTNRSRLVADVTAVDKLKPGQLSAVVGEIDWARAQVIGPEAYAAAASARGRRPGVAASFVAEVYVRYEEAKHTKRLVDFDDLLLLCAREIERDRQFAEVQRWRFRHFFVDEFQDVNPLQARLLEAWRGERSDLCVVGDPNQAIYGWNGADPTRLTEIERHYPGVTVVRLGHNYRSTPQVLAAAGQVLTRAGLGGEPPTAARNEGPAPRVHRFADADAEAAGIVALLRGRGPVARRWSACAVLVRTNAQTAPIEKALRAAGIPCRVRTNPSAADEPAARSALRELSERPGLHPLREWVEDVQGELEETGAPANDPRRRLVTWAHAYLDDGGEPTAAAFRLWLTTGGPADAAGDADGVEIVTFHAAKGLEWPFVIVAGMEDGLVPHRGAIGPAGRAEEARLAYVAMTRAEHELILTWAARRGRNPDDRAPSPFLPHVAQAEVIAPPPTMVPARPLTPATPDPLVTALHSWRAGAARLSGLPPAAVCSDAALARIAATRPATIDALAAVDGVGPLAARRFGPRLLAIVADAPT